MAPFPAQVSDVHAAIRWLRANAARFNLDGQHIGAGAGAGAQLAAFLGTTDDVQAADVTSGSPPIFARVEAVVDSAGPTAAVLPYVKADAAPFLILQGEDDTVDAPAESQTLYDALRSANVPATMVLYPGATHDPALWSSADVLTQVDSFFDQTLRSRGRRRPSASR